MQWGQRWQRPKPVSGSPGALCSPLRICAGSWFPEPDRVGGSACGRRAGLRTHPPWPCSQRPCSQLCVLVCASQPAVWASAGHGKGNVTVTETAPVTARWRAWERDGPLPVGVCDARSRRRCFRNVSGKPPSFSFTRSQGCGEGCRRLPGTSMGRLASRGTQEGWAPQRTWDTGTMSHASASRLLSGRAQPSPLRPLAAHSLEACPNLGQ